ncbi:MAG: hypothetical protein GXO07_03840 [Crenarchaeota archaeon]|nr:hypothetical protein [Thermoproteota archaeon]
MKAALLEFEYMNSLVQELKSKGYEVIRTTPEKSLYAFWSGLVDLAVVSSVAASSLALEPCLTCPAVYSIGEVENVKLIIKKMRNKLRLWVTPKSYTGRALAKWFLMRRGIKFVYTGNREEADAVVLIGDEAREVGDGVDLGKAWYEAHALPLVYAVTLSRRPERIDVRYVWRKVRVTPLIEVIEGYIATVKELRDYWVRPPLPPRGLLGLLLRSLK